MCCSTPSFVFKRSSVQADQDDDDEMPFLPFHRSRCPSTPSRVVAALPHSPACPAAASAGTTSPLIVAPRCAPSVASLRITSLSCYPLAGTKPSSLSKGPAGSTPLPSPLLCLCWRSSMLRRHITIAVQAWPFSCSSPSVRGPLIVSRPLPLAGTTPSSLSIGPAWAPHSSPARSPDSGLRTYDVRALRRAVSPWCPCVLPCPPLGQPPLSLPHSSACACPAFVEVAEAHHDSVACYQCRVPALLQPGASVSWYPFFSHLQS